MQRIAEVLDVGVNELLGADFTQNADNNEVAQQLARINEQLAIKNRRWNLFWKIVGIILLLNVVLAILGFVLFGAITSSTTTEVGEAEEVMMDEEYIEE